MTKPNRVDDTCLRCHEDLSYHQLDGLCADQAPCSRDNPRCQTGSCWVCEVGIA